MKLEKKVNCRIRITVRGIVQGVGFRPFIHRCAKERNLPGFVVNTTNGVIIEAQGRKDILENFIDAILTTHPPLAKISEIKIEDIPLSDDIDFVTKQSKSSHNTEPGVPPDFSLCNDCIKELFDPSNRRYRYPFINCTNCGPRFTIIKGLPYDRPLTSMASFTMCSECAKEYANPLDRRFHAELNACPVCGPKLSWVLPDGTVAAEGDDALRLCKDTIASGGIAGVKGIGGFHLMTDASKDNCVCLLRDKKHRFEKPFAVMFPFGRKDMLSYIRAEAFLNNEEEMAMLQGERPIVILKRRSDSRLSKFISPGLNTLGVFLPYSPIHYLLFADLNIPLIATSANFNDNPIIKDNKEAISKLGKIANGLLLHNRDIVRKCDDSVISVYNGKTIIFRQGRGYSPQIFKLPYKLNEPVLSVGGNQKVAIAIGWEDKAVISQHLGDLTTAEGFHAFEEAILDLTSFYNVQLLRIVSDMHPDYLSTKWASSQKHARHIHIQHHHAHIASCMVDNNLTDTVLGICWDGAGYGLDGTVWGGEFLIADYKGFERIGTFKKFRLIGGEHAVKEPRRTFLSMLYEMKQGAVISDQWSETTPLKDIFTETELKLFLQMLKNGFNSPFTSSAGRVFDAAASMLRICQKANYEGQGAMMLEDRADSVIGSSYPIEVIEKDGLYVFDWSSMFKVMISDMLNGIDVKIISQNFHETLSQLILYMAKTIKNKSGINIVCLSGGVFQNKLLVQRTLHLLKDNGFNAYTHNTLPPNDGGISMGQLIIGGF